MYVSFIPFWPANTHIPSAFFLFLCSLIAEYCETEGLQGPLWFNLIGLFLNIVHHNL